MKKNKKKRYGFTLIELLVTILIIGIISTIGYVTYNYVEAGKDNWYCPDTGQFIPYNYTNIYFVKFVKEPDNSNKTIIL